MPDKGFPLSGSRYHIHRMEGSKRDFWQDAMHKLD